MKTDINLEKIWEEMKMNAEKQKMIIKIGNGKELIVDKLGKQFFMKCKARDLKNEKTNR